MDSHRNSFHTTQWESTLRIFAQREWRNELVYYLWFLKENIVSYIASTSFVDLLKYVNILKVFIYMFVHSVNIDQLLCDRHQIAGIVTLIYAVPQSLVWVWEVPFSFLFPYSCPDCREYNSCPYIVSPWELRPVWLARF